MKTKKLILALLAAALIMITPMAVFAAQQDATSSDMGKARTDAVNKVEAATRVLNEIQGNPDQSIPPSVLHGAAGVAIIPGMVKAGLIAGGRHGSGVLLTQNNGKWSPPVFVSISGGSLGAQIGVQSTDLILVFNNRDVVRKVVENGNWTIGAGASVAAGTAGAKAKTSSNNADVLAYKRTQGLFAGASVSGADFSLDQDPLMAYYGFNKQNKQAMGYYANKEQMAEAILHVGPKKNKQIVQNVPQSAEQLQKTLNQYASKSQQGQ